ncbi:MAG TPA: TetR family transcriptional regulator [Pseudobdellovibrionaceae bacterium]|nr:TetR family transcriptional regulator [Pseudobdellovibrionaceae bacterium]
MAKKTKTSLKRPRRAAVVPEGARDKIMNVARRLFAEYGLEGVSVRDISKEAGLNVSLVSYYFGGKEGLYSTILETHAREVQRSLLAVLAPFRENEHLTKESFHSVIESFVRNMVEMRLQIPEMSLIIQRERFSGLPHARKNHEEIFGPLNIEFDAFMKTAIRKKIVRPNLPVVPYFMSIVESIMGYFLFQECHMKMPGDYFHLPDQKEQYIEFLTRLFTEGIYK